MKFSQELVDDTVLPKMEMSEMSMKKKSKLSKEIGAELVKRTKNLNKNIETIMGKVAKLEENNEPLAWVVISEDGVERPTCITEAQAIAVANNLKYHREALKIVPLYTNPPVVAKNTTSQGKSAKSQPKSESLSVSNGLVMYLYDAGDSHRNFVRMDFNDYSTYNDFHMILDRSKLKEVAGFINKYLENN